MIPLAQPDITQAEVDAVTEVLLSGTLTAGGKVEEFEEKCAAVAGRRHGVAVSSGTAALHCALLAAGIKPGDEVITTPFSFVASANAALFVDAKPVFVDIDPKTLNMDPGLVEKAITAKTKAIVAVEAFGHPGGIVQLEQIARRNELVLIEDACEGFGGKRAGRPLGNFGRASVFSFYPNKPITTAEGGMVVTDDDKFASQCRSLRNSGRDGMAWLAHRRLGFNYRLSELHAALGVSQLGRLAELLDSRRQAAVWYMNCLMDEAMLILPTLCEEDEASWFVFVVRLTDLFEAGDRDEAMRQLRMRGIGCNNYFPPIHLQPYMRERFGFEPGSLPVCEHVSERTLALPFFSGITKAQVERVCETLRDVLEKVLTGRKRRAEI
jgi:perosamine synthetase